MHPLPSARRAAPLAIALVLLGGTAPLARAQTLGGQVVQLATKKPLGGAAVALVNDSARVVASTAASPDGAFYLDAPTAGGYRVVLFVSGASFVSPALQLDSGQTVERLFSVPDVPETFSSALFARDVTTAVTPFPGTPLPVYPPRQAERRERALISAMFVVDEKGQPDLSTFRVLSSGDDAFASAIRDALTRSRFVPAEKDGAAVRQVVQYTYDFGFPDDPIRGDVVIRPGGTPPPVAAVKSSRGKYVISAEELAQPDIRTLSIIDAMRRLRPQIFTESAKNPYTLNGTNSGQGVVYVDDALSDGGAALTELRAGQAREVRYWTREEAGIRFGMDYWYAITVKLRK
ncbi:MAG: tonB [Gemmatimonadetes bacterium]|nr:tonB [Gemmatimonadota bacterium]